MKIDSKINVSFLEAVVHREDDQLTLGGGGGGGGGGGLPSGSRLRGTTAC